MSSLSTSSGSGEVEGIVKANPLDVSPKRPRRGRP